MEFFKCNLYIVGRPGIGKTSLRKVLEEFIHPQRSTSNLFKGPDWLIQTENVHIEVETKEVRNLDLPFLTLASKEIKNIIIYMIDDHEHKMEFTIPPKDVEQLNVISKESTIIIAPVYRPFEFNKNFNLRPLKKNISFVEYFLPIHDFRYREFETFSLTSLIRQIIINAYPSTLKYAKKLIKENFETKNPTLDLGNCGLTSLKGIQELFENTHIKI